MKKVIGVLLIVCGFAIAQLPLSSLYLPMWDGTSGRYVWRQLRNGFTLSGNYIDVTPQAAVLSTPMRGVRLTYDAAGNKYALPVDAPLVLSVYVNGLRYASPGDFTITSRSIIPSCVPGVVDCNWPLGAIVLVDYDK